MKEKQGNISLQLGVLAPSSITLGLLVIFGCLSFFWLMGGKSATEITIAVSLFLVMIAASAAAIFYFSAAVRRPVSEALKAIDEVSKGDLTRRIEIDSHDELGRMGKNFNTLMDTFQDTLAKVSDSGRKISFASNTLDTTAKLMTRGVDAIVTEVSSVASASEEMASTSNEIARNCAVAADSSNIVSRSAHTGESIIQGIVTAMTKIGGKVRESEGIIKGLGERSDQIGAIAGIINDIADQTNLLALNAAIEAARAGEQGRGFAVVADEVRKLAERTARATEDIGKTIQAMQTETKSAVMSMADGVREVEAGTEETEKSGDALKEILRQVNTLTSQIDQIAVASEQQTSTTNEITGNIQKISEVMGSASGNIRENGEASSMIAGLSVDLNTLVQKFKLRSASAGGPSAGPEDAIALVKKAADYVRKNGKDKAFREFNNATGMFVKGDLYIFAQDMTGVMKAHPMNKILIGKDVSDMKDVDGKYFGKQLLETAKTKGNGWVDYNWMNPATNEVIAKSTYCMRIEDTMVACGIYRQ
jgi:methyl-accepting chemotaxis protein